MTDFITEMFGVKEKSLPDINGMEPRYEMETGKNGDPNYLKQIVFRDKNGNYFLYVKGGAHARFDFGTSYPLAGKELLIPFAPEALLDWAVVYLAGEECACAMEEFKRSDVWPQSEKVWQYQNEVEMGQPGYIHEFLLKTDVNAYVLFSTDCSYPCFGRNMTLIDTNEDGLSCVRDDMYVYYVTPETARRWAKMRGMDEHTYRALFGN